MCTSWTLGSSRTSLSLASQLPTEYQVQATPSTPAGRVPKPTMLTPSGVLQDPALLMLTPRALRPRYRCRALPLVEDMVHEQLVLER